MGPIIRAMRHNKTRFILIILEIAFTLAIVTNCVNMILEERRTLTHPSGFDDHNIVWMRSRPFAPEFRETKYMDENIKADLRTIAAIPGVKAVASTNFRPWQGGGSSTTVREAGNKQGSVLRTQIYYGTEGMFDTLGAPIASGRGFVPNDFDYPDGANPKVAVISRALAKLLFGDASPVGKVIVQPEGKGAGIDSDPFTIVGVIDEFYNPYGWPIHEYVVFAPSPVGSYARGSRFLIRVEPGSMQSTTAEIEKRLVAANGGRVLELETIDSIKAEFQSGSRLIVGATTGVIIILVFVTGLGILGITSLSVAERTRQIGTRRALGATRGDILRHFLAENWIITSVGLILGIAATYGLNFLLVSRVSDVKMSWPLVAVGMVLLWIAGLAATIPPALRASMVSPAIATRSI
ncbi:MAG: ABC transporter permease [Acidobacteria bacterium]|nr:ABC transporter permease [Acidobacteriota bacterium]